MRILAYDTDEKTLLGWWSDGVFVPLPPAPEGTALIALVDEVCSTIENYFGKFFETGKLVNRIHSDLRQVEGQHSELLMDGMQRWGVQHPDTKGVRSWIIAGSLRSHDELAPVLNEFVSDMQFKQRNRLIRADWVLDADGLAIIGAKFGLPEPPTREQRAAKAAENQAQHESQRKAANEERNRQDEWEAEAELKARKKKLVERICVLFFPFDGCGIDGDTVSSEFLAMQLSRKNFRRSSTDLVHLMVDEGRSDEEIIGEVRMLQELGFSGFGGDWLSAPLDPLDEGQRLFFKKPSEIIAYYGSAEAQALLKADFKFVTGLMMDGRWCVTVAKKTDADLAREASIDAESAQ